MSINPLNDISKVYLEQVSETSHLETDMKKRREANEKAIKDMKKTAAYKSMAATAAKKFDEEFVDPEHGESPSGRSPLQNVSDHPKASVRKAAVKGFKKQMEKEYGGKWKSRSSDPVKEALDPVGHEDADVDNDGKKNTKSDKYLLNRRKAIGKAISTQEAKEVKRWWDDDGDGKGYEEGEVSGKFKKKKKIKEGFSNWRQDLSEVMTDIKAEKKVTEKKINNKVVINPKLDLGEAVENLGGTLLEMEEIGEAKVEAEKSEIEKKDIRSRRYVEKTKGAEGVRNYDAMGSTAPNWVTAARRRAHAAVRGVKKEEIQIDEKTLTAAETKEKERLVKSMKDRAADFEKRYPGRGKEVMYATATKMAKKIAEQALELQPKTQSSQQKPDQQQKKLQQQADRMRQQEVQILQRKLQALKSAPKGTDPSITAGYEPEGEMIDERRRSEKGTPRAPRNPAFELVAKSMGAGRMGVQPRGQKKVPGEKKPNIQSTPTQKVAKRRDAAQRAQDMMHSRYD